MAEKAYYVTEEGLAALQAELEDLKVNRRKEVAEKIKEALSFGDLSENSEYDEAKNDQAILEARIADLHREGKPCGGYRAHRFFRVCKNEACGRQ